MKIPFNKLAEFFERKRREYINGTLPPIRRKELEETFPWWAEICKDRQQWRSFETARRFIHSLKLKSTAEWYVYRKSDPQTHDIPTNPNIVYKDQGWISHVDFIGIPDKWGLMLEELIRYKKRNNDFPPSRSAGKLGKWCCNQRVLYNQHKLPKEKINLLESIGFNWNMRQTKWENQYNKLLEFRNKYGHCDVAGSDSGLGAWCDHLRKSYRKGKVPRFRVDRLNEINFNWEYRRLPSDQAWDGMYRQLLKFQKKNRHCNAQRSVGELGTWCQTQRDNYKNGKLSQERIDKLNKFGFSWEPHDVVWDKSYNDLADFKKENGHCNVPSETNLASWCQTQRGSFRKKVLSKDRIDKLNKLEFNWNPRNVWWNTSYDDLIQFKKDNGHCDAPQKTKLGVWCNNQRQSFKKNNLSKDRIKLLNKLGFKWALPKGPRK